MRRSEVWGRFRNHQFCLVGETLAGLFHSPSGRVFCALVTCPVIIALMLALAGRLTVGAQEASCLLVPKIIKVIEISTECMCLCSFTLKAVQSWILLMQQRSSLSKGLRFSWRYVSTSEIFALLLWNSSHCPFGYMCFFFVCFQNIFFPLDSLQLKCNFPASHEIVVHAITDKIMLSKSCRISVYFSAKCTKTTYKRFEFESWNMFTTMLHHFYQHAKREDTTYCIFIGENLSWCEISVVQ